MIQQNRMNWQVPTVFIVQYHFQLDPGVDPSPLSPSALKLPNLSLWEIPSSSNPSGRSQPSPPGLYSPPDVHSLVSGQYPLEEAGGPLSQMNEVVNNIDKQVKEEKVRGKDGYR